ncbi:MAG: hypothetical protein WC307_03220 [Candidatus Nanoarchaeia archaeon]|jgi:hypothetical protein
MKLKALTNELLELLPGAVKEYRTPDGTRIDVAVPEIGLAIELENTYKWIDRRVLFNAVKAQRAGFKDLVIIYPFKDDCIRRSWVMKYVKELGINLTIIKPDKINNLKKIK